MNHPRDNDLALLAGGETGRIRRFLLDRHVRTCADCRETITEYQRFRAELADLELPDLNWNFLASDMRANIRLGLEAGACVRTPRVFKLRNPRLGIAFASLAVLAVSGFFMRDVRFRPSSAEVTTPVTTPVLQLTKSGVEILTGADSSLTLLNHPGNAVNQTVSAQGDISARYIDSETGSVTINNVRLQ